VVIKNEAEPKEAGDKLASFAAAIFSSLSMQVHQSKETASVGAEGVLGLGPERTLGLSPGF
jgi:hypothetical protein